MARYRYSEQLALPAPFVYALIGNPNEPLITEELPAQIDCGADRSVIPQSIIDQLRLQPSRQVVVAGLGGNVRHINTYYVIIHIRGLEAVEVEAIGADGEPFVLIGRDVLNDFRVVLDGPNKLLEISE